MENPNSHFDPIAFFESTAEEDYTDEVERAIEKKMSILERKRESAKVKLKEKLSSITDYDYKKLMSGDWDAGLVQNEIMVSEAGKDKRVGGIINEINKLTTPEYYDSMYKQAVREYRQDKINREKNSKIFKKNLTRIVSAAIILPILGFVGNQIYFNIKMNANRKTVNQLVAGMEYIQAQDLLTRFIESDSLRPKDIVELTQSIQTAQSDEVFIQKLNTPNLEDRLKNCQKYLEIKPEGKYKEEAITNIITDNFTLYNQSLTSLNYDESFSKILQLNLTLEKYSKEDINLSDLVNIKEVVSQGKNNLDKIGNLPKRLNLGEEVIFTHLDSKPFSRTYIQKRDKLYPLGSIGKIIYYDDDIFYVDFGKNTPMEMPGYFKRSSAEENIKAYQEDGIFTAGFTANELRYPTTSIQKNKLNLELDKMQNLFETYYQK
jgi:hypothetical protein